VPFYNSFIWGDGFDLYPLAPAGRQSLTVEAAAREWIASVRHRKSRSEWNLHLGKWRQVMEGNRFIW